MKVNPIEKAVAPLKALAIERAENALRDRIERFFTKLAEADHDIKVVAPYPSRFLRTVEYRLAEREYHFAHSLVRTDYDRGYSGRPSEPHYVTRANDRIEKQVEQVRKLAAAHYEAYVAKLIGKIGDCDSATLTYSGGLWYDSTLRIEKPSGTELWNTKIILNFSKYGLPFNQWPTRQLKNRAAR